MTVIVGTLIDLYIRSPLITNIFILIIFALTFSFYLEERIYYCLVKNDGFQGCIVVRLSLMRKTIIIS